MKIMNGNMADIYFTQLKSEVCNLDRILHNKKLDFTNAINK